MSAWVYAALFVAFVIYGNAAMMKRDQPFEFTKDMLMGGLRSKAQETIFGLRANGNQGSMSSSVETVQ